MGKIILTIFTVLEVPTQILKYKLNVSMKCFPIAFPVSFNGSSVYFVILSVFVVQDVLFDIVT